MAESGLTMRFDITNPIFVTTIYCDRSPVSAERCVDRVDGWDRQLNTAAIRSSTFLSSFLRECP